ncbi:hypothetical protein BO82DRAFT_204891 [Aspergillus uvarum CBS 121591]|uniref:Uncharacterized protein n=1 Tax=Aspergillus uvarum CBS 121591 TaxID=1448315 RepID=A0A319CCT9_9EURO|nr:hypothetical protein BO82DRAFT_204891 [Aspergillus uvarum CBS 121591]PYH76473.1 hypothetical protein BO82DRAFT_204891 [Aspergillus uvarum CBS 121591]
MDTHPPPLFSFFNTFIAPLSLHFLLASVLLECRARFEVLLPPIPSPLTFPTPRSPCHLPSG